MGNTRKRSLFHRKKWASGLTLLGVLLLVSMCLTTKVSAQNQSKSVRVAVLNYVNYIQMDQHGNVTGYAYDYLMQIAKYTGWEYEFEEMTLEQANTALEKGKIDIVVGCRYTEERSKKYDFSSLAMGQGGSVLCTLTDNNGYYFNDFNNYDGMKVAALKGTVRIEQLETLLDQYGVHVHIFEYDTDQECKEALKEKEVDSILMSSIRCENNYKIIARIDSNPLYFALNKNRPELKRQIDEAMKQLALVNPYYALELEAKYYGDIITQISLTQEESEYIKNCGVIQVATSADMVPNSYYDEKSGSFQGIIPDSYALISQYTGLQFEFVEREETQTLQDQMETGQVQLIAAVVESTYVKNSYHISLTAPYSRNSLTVVQNKSAATKNETRSAVVLNVMPFL